MLCLSLSIYFDPSQRCAGRSRIPGTTTSCPRIKLTLGCVMICGAVIYRPVPIASTSSGTSISSRVRMMTALELAEPQLAIVVETFTHRPCTTIWMARFAPNQHEFACSLGGVREKCQKNGLRAWPRSGPGGKRISQRAVSQWLQKLARYHRVTSRAGRRER